MSSAAALHVAANLVNTENILVDGAGYLKLTDFGFAKELIAVRYRHVPPPLLASSRI